MTLLSKLYYIYKARFYKPYGKKFRGTTRILDTLAEMATRHLETIDETHPLHALDWDHVLILDACRHDLYEEVNGETPSRNTVGSHSREFIRYLGERSWEDTIYITANGHGSSSHFKEIAGVRPEVVFFQYHDAFLEDWDEEQGTVIPEMMLDRVEEFSERYPEKRMIVHFMQPHVPFLHSDEDLRWDDAGIGKTSQEEIRAAYRDNLEYVMPYAREACRLLDGTVAITSDHGNLVGEDGMYDHPEGLDVKALREVPWDVHD